MHDKQKFWEIKNTSTNDKNAFSRQGAQRP